MFEPSPQIRVAFGVLIGAFAFASISCASLHPPLQSPDDEASSSLQLSAYRADTDGLTLTLQARFARPDDELQLWRRRDNGDWTLAETFSVNEPLSEALTKGKVQWRDPVDAPSAHLHYRMTLRQNGTDATESIEVHWTGWPDSTALQADVTDGADPEVVLSWTADGDYDAHILRRDILDDDKFSSHATVDASADPTFYDDVSPGDVYAYRIQLIDRLSVPPRYGELSESVYVSVPD